MSCVRGAVLPIWAGGLIVAGIVFNQRPVADATDPTEADAVHNIRSVPQHREIPNDPWMPRPSKAPAAAIGHCGPWERGPFKSFQVNVNKIGCNIVGDAANEPSIALDPTDPNRLVIGWRQFDSVESDFRQAGWAYSHDGGQAWTFPGVLEPGVFRSDPVLDADAEGNIYFYSLTDDFTCDLFKSVDRGLSWLEPVSAFGGDKAWMAIDRTSGIGRGNIYCIWSFCIDCSGTFTRSTDGGSTFMEPIREGGWWGTVTVGPDGEVYVSGRAERDLSRRFTAPVRKSTNAHDPNVTPVFEEVRVDLGGRTPDFLGGSFGPNPGGLLGQVWIATDHSDGASRGNVYLLASVEPDSNPRFDPVVFFPLDVTFVRSTDGGWTWSLPIRINDDAWDSGAWQWFGTMAVAPNGRIDVVWNDTRNDEPGVFATHSELFYAYSTDGGAHWSPNIPVSPPFNHFVGYPGGNQKLGDYYDMISDNGGANVAYAATFNGEQDVYFLRVVVDCNGNDIHDGTDILSGISDDSNANAVPDECENLVTLYVDKNAAGADDGSSWNDAYVNLQDALDEAARSHAVVGEVWVAAGTHTADRGAEQTPGDRNATFQLVSGVTIYGGFSGEETNLDQRDPWRNVTILSGDLNGDDQVRSDTNCCEDRAKPGCESASCESAVCDWDPFCCDEAWDFACVDSAVEICGFCCESRCHRTDNCPHVVTGSGTDPSAELDGFMVTGGVGDGGGMFIRQGSPVVRNCVFDDNVGKQGGAMFVEDGSPTVINTVFSHNEVNSGFGEGGAVYFGLRQAGFLQRVIFTNCLFYQNHALRGGGALYKPGGFFELTVELQNCTFAFNSTDGRVGGVSGSNAVTNCILWGNADSNGTNESAQMVGSGPVNYTCVQGWTGTLGGTGNLGDDPLFVAGPQSDYYLSQQAAGQESNSPCLDAGSDTAAKLGLDTRTTRNDECPDTGTVDIGYHYPVRQPTVAGDFDRNGLVNLPDAAAFQNCFTGVGLVQIDPCCQVLDTEPDGDVDLDDYNALYQTYIGPAGGIPVCGNGRLEVGEQCDAPDDPTCDDQCRVDSDQDGIPDDDDPCPNDPDNDVDDDGICGDLDPCPNDPENDADGDGLCGDVDVCPHDPDNDIDNDAVCGDVDNCPDIFNPKQENFDADALGDACDECPNDRFNDADGDGVCGDVDRCPGFDDNVDTDQDGIPDGCDLCPNDPGNDTDNDGLCGDQDPCPNDPDNDADADGICGDVDVCPSDPNNDEDGDGVCGNIDFCPGTPEGTVVDQIGCPPGTSTWDSTRRLTADYLPPDAYNFNAAYHLTTAEVNPNVEVIESNSFGGTVRVLRTEIPLGTRTLVYWIDDFFSDQGIVGGTLIQAVTIEAFSLTLDGSRATWTFHYSVVNDVELPGFDPGSERTEFDAVMSGDVSAADFEITFTEVTGAVTRCDLFDEQCNTRPLEPDEFGAVTWTRR